MEHIPDVSVCIVSWNTCGQLRDCLHSLFAPRGRASLEVIVVDNASSDGTPAAVRDEFPQVQVIANPVNVGFARGNNQAFQVARGRHLLVLNSDTVVLPGALDAMVAFLDRESDAAAVGCRLLNADGSVQRSCWRGFPSLQSAVVDAFYLWHLAPGCAWVRATEVTCAVSEPVEVDHLLGACMLVRRAAVERIGAMCEEFFLFSEETEWCWRMRRGGWRVCFLPDVSIVHIGQQSVQQAPQRTLPEKYRSFVHLYRRLAHPSRLRVWSVKLVIMAAAAVRIALWTWRQRPASRRALARRMRSGYWQVLRQTASL